MIACSNGARVFSRSLRQRNGELPAGDELAGSSMEQGAAAIESIRSSQEEEGRIQEDGGGCERGVAKGAGDRGEKG